MDDKFCSGCGHHKPIADFYRNRSRPDGLNYYCKDCYRLCTKGAFRRNRDRLDPQGNLLEQRCTICNQWLPAHSYWKNKLKRNGLLSACKSCSAAQRKAYYDADQEKYRATARRAAAKRYTIIEKAKQAPCTDCGGHFPPYMMDFDHVRGEKVFALGQAGSRSCTTIQNEIAKCDLVCANCHRERTHRRKVRS